MFIVVSIHSNLKVPHFCKVSWAHCTLERVVFLQEVGLLVIAMKKDAFETLEHYSHLRSELSLQIFLLSLLK